MEIPALSETAENSARSSRENRLASLAESTYAIPNTFPRLMRGVQMALRMARCATLLE